MRYPIDINSIPDILKLAGVPEERIIYPERELSDYERCFLLYTGQ